MSTSLRPYGLQQASLSCPSLAPRVCSNSCPLNWWCYLIILSSVALFSFCLLSFPASGSFPMCQLFAAGGQSIRASEWPQLGHSLAPQSRKAFFCHVPPLAGRSNLTLHLGIDQPMTGFQQILICLDFFRCFYIASC